MDKFADDILKNSDVFYNRYCKDKDCNRLQRNVSHDIYVPMENCTFSDRLANGTYENVDTSVMHVVLMNIIILKDCTVICPKIYMFLLKFVTILWTDWQVAHMKMEMSLAIYIIIPTNLLKTSQEKMKFTRKGW